MVAVWAIGCWTCSGDSLRFRLNWSDICTYQRRTLCGKVSWEIPVLFRWRLICYSRVVKNTILISSVHSVSRKYFFASRGPTATLSVHAFAKKENLVTLSLVTNKRSCLVSLSCSILSTCQLLSLWFFQWRLNSSRRRSSLYWLSL